MGYIKIYLWRI